MRTALLLLVMATAAHAQSYADAAMSQADLDLAVRRGSVATLAPLCGLRDQGWSEDLRRAAIQDATRSPSPDDLALQAAPGSDLAVGALGYADTEALESFAEAAPSVACRKLAHNPDLGDADLRVATYRQDVRRSQRQW